MKNKRRKNLKLFLLLPVIVAVLILFPLLSSCSFGQLFYNFVADESISADIEKINLDENEIKSLKISDKTAEEMIDTSNEIKISSDKLRDPFMPFYFNPDSDGRSQKNKLSVEKIYSQDGIFYTEINLNDSVYKLKKDDLFGKIYQVKAINADSIVLLKGDEIITIYINEIYYD